MAAGKKMTKASANVPSKKAKAAPAKARSKSETLKLGEASPGLTVNDLQKSLAWYRDVLGFSVEERWEQEGKLMGVSLRAGGVRSGRSPRMPDCRSSPCTGCLPPRRASTFTRARSRSAGGRWSTSGR